MSSNMVKLLDKAYCMADKLFPRISKACKKCNLCCKTYGWLIKEEKEIYLKKGIPIVTINEEVHCIDSFEKDEEGKRILNEIPRCKFYKNGKCSIYRKRPLDCRLYPIKIRFQRGKSFLNISLGCKYIESLSKKAKQKLYKRVVDFVKKAPNEIIQKYIDLMEKISRISRPKRLEVKKLIEFRKKDGSWEIEKVLV